MGVGAPAAGRAGGTDLWLAVIAGEQAWTDPDAPPTSLAKTTAAIELGALTAVISAIWLMYTARDPAPVGFANVAPIAGTAAALALAIRPIRLLLARRRDTRVWLSVIWRSACGVIVIASLLANAPAWSAFALSPFGIVVGTEAVLAAWEVGLAVQPLLWWVRFLLSPGHAGIVGSLVALWVWSGTSEFLRSGIPLYLIIQLIIGTACVTAAVLETLRRQQIASDAAASQEIASAEHRRTAHWLHDDVSAQLRIVRLRLQEEKLPTDEVAELLDELDQQLRLRQLEELLASGVVVLAEILQPYVRDAQRHGITITRVPAFEDASLVVDSSTGRLFARAAAITTANSIQAGATSLGYTVHYDDRSISLSVIDDAGGFDLNDIPAGRALWTLSQELGPGGLDVNRSGADTTLTVTIPHVRSNGNGQPSPR